MTLQSLYNHFAQSKESSWIMKPYNARSLFDFIKNHPVKNVLELGTGIGLSTAVAALALQEKGEKDWHIHTIEQYDKCIRLANQLIPKELLEHITIHKANPVVWNTEKIPHQYFSVYDQLPEGDFNLIINDGPSPFMEGEHYIDLPNGTILQLLLADKLKKGTLIAYDGRLQSLSLIERYFSDNFLIIPGEGNDFNVLERKDNPLAFNDFIFERMKSLNYFSDEKKENINNNNGASTSSSATPSDQGTKKAV